MTFSWRGYGAGVVAYVRLMSKISKMLPPFDAEFVASRDGVTTAGMAVGAGGGSAASSDAGVSASSWTASAAGGAGGAPVSAAAPQVGSLA